MKIKSLLWFFIVFSAAGCLSNVTALGEKPAMDDSTSTMTTANPLSIPVEVLYRDQQCSISQAETRWIDTPQTYQTLFETLRKTYMGGQEQQPIVDFSADSVLLVAMGQKNTGGYAVELADNKGVLEASVLKIAVQWREPKPGMMVTQVLTSPCMLLKIPKVDFERIEIKDQNGVTRISGAR